MEFEYLPNDSPRKINSKSVNNYTPTINSISFTQPIIIDSEIMNRFPAPDQTSNINISIIDDALPREHISIPPICNLSVSSHGLHSTPDKLSIISSNLEYKEDTQIVNGGRKRGKVNKRKKTQIKKNHINTEWLFTFNNSCNHFENKIKNVCNISQLIEEDVMSLRNSLLHIKLKVDQDKFLLTMLVIKNPNRTDRRKTSRKERNTITYYIPRKSGEKIKVCGTAFSNITSFTSRRITILAKKFHEGNVSPKEIRGGSRVSVQDEEISNDIIKFIQKFKNKKSHYARNDTGRSYLQPGLSVKMMWEYWKKKRLNKGKLVSSLTKFNHIFVNNFNLSFGHPKQDVCSFCTELTAKIKIETDDEVKTTKKNELVCHKENSKIFSKMLSTVKPGCISVCFDMMQNQPLPKLSVLHKYYIL